MLTFEKILFLIADYQIGYHIMPRSDEVFSYLGTLSDRGSTDTFDVFVCPKITKDGQNGDKMQNLNLTKKSFAHRNILTATCFRYCVDIQKYLITRAHPKR